MPSHEHVEVVPGENVEDQDDDFECTKRRLKNGLPQNHSSKAARIEQHNEVVSNSDNVKTKSLSNLPSGIHHIIFGNLDNIEDILQFSLVNRYFWALGLTHIENHIVASLALWAGEELVCAGNCSEPGDFPPGVFNQPRSKQAEGTKASRNTPMDLYSMGVTYTKVGGPSLSQTLREWFQQYQIKHPFSKADHAEVMMGLQPQVTEFYPRDQAWILRNLTTKEYVRGEVIALKEGFIRGPQIDVLGFSEVLVARIYWSTQAEKVNRNLSRGKWAGHQFDITSFQYHEHNIEGEKWTDVSNEVLRELDVIFSSKLGDDWRDNLIQAHLERTQKAKRPDHAPFFPERF